MFNATVIGNLGYDPKLREVTTDNGTTKVTTISIASNKTSGGRKITTWFSADLWGAEAERAVKYLRKGSRVGVAALGIGIETWEGKDGQPDYGLKLYNVQRVEYLDGGNGNGQSEETEETF